MLPSPNRLSWAILTFALLLGGCAPKIGKSCTLSTDCSQLGDRLCDTTQPDGYCTIFNCEPDTCPESACVGFYAQLDPACGTSDDGRTPRFERTFCMAPCSSDSTCRDGYQCVDLSRNDPNDPLQRGAKIVDIVNDIGATKVCMAKVTERQPPETCTNSRKDGAETDMDCGGPRCLPCVNGKACASSSDCVSLICENNICVGPAVCSTGDAGAPWTPYDAGAPDAAAPDAGQDGGGGAGSSSSTSSSSGMGGAGGMGGMGGMSVDAGDSG